MTYWVGLTGGIGSGKSMVSDLFSRLNIPIINADQISRCITSAGGSAIPAIMQTFGEDFITKEGALDRDKMRSLVFSSSLQQAKLEKILHPLIADKIKIAQRNIPPANIYGIIEIPLLAEHPEFKQLVDRILVVNTSEDLQIKRVIERNGWTEKDVLSIINKQATYQQKLAIANDVIDNNASLAKLEQKVLNMHDKYMELFTHAK